MVRIVTVAAGNYDFTRNEVGTSAYTRKKSVGVSPWERIYIKHDLAKMIGCL